MSAMGEIVESMVRIRETDALALSEVLRMVVDRELLPGDVHGELVRRSAPLARALGEDWA